MDPARAALLESVWQTLIRKKKTLTAKIAELRVKIKTAKGSELTEAFKLLALHETQLELIDEIVTEGSQ